MMSVICCGFDLVVAALNLVTQCCLVIDCVVSYCFLTHCGLWYILYKKAVNVELLGFSIRFVYVVGNFLGSRLGSFCVRDEVVT